jgi:hypothetical protein
MLWDEKVRSSEWKLFDPVDLNEVAGIGADGPEDRWEIAVFGARERFVSARAPLHLCFEVAGWEEADLVPVLSVLCFVMASEGVGVAALFEGGLLNRRE